MLKPRFVERARLLPYSGHVIVEPNQWVSETETVARIDYIPGSMRRFQAADTLRVSGKALRQQMLLPDGAPVEVGDPVAASYCFGERRVVTSPYAGYIGLVSKGLGNIYIREPIPVGSGEPEVLDVPAALGVQPRLVGDCLRVSPGHAVIPGQVVATRQVERKTLVVQASVYGKVTDIVDGVITIKPLHVSTELPAYLAGRISQVMPGQGVVVKSYAYLVQGQYGVGGETGGRLLVAGGADSELDRSAATSSWEDKVVVVGATASLALLEAAAAAGARALVMAYLPMRTLQEFTAGTGTVGLTGDEDVPFTIVMTEGFLPQRMSERAYKTLQALEGRYAAVNGTTHIRAGVIRPEVVVCESEWPTADDGSSDAEPELDVGSVVRITRSPHAGQVGRVIELPAARQRIVTGSQVRVAQVELAHGTVTVPVSNLEIWSAGGGGQHV